MTGQDLAGRAGIVTGASRGIGLAIAEALVRRGASVCITGRDRDALAAAADVVVCLLVPERFCGAGAHYDDFAPPSDDDVRALLTRRRRGASGDGRGLGVRERPTP